MRRPLALLVALALAAEAGALSVRIAPLVLLDMDAEALPEASRPDRDLERRLSSSPIAESVEFALAEKADAAPLSFLEAARVCERRGYSCLVYGYLRKRESVYSAELKLLSREGKRIEASFVATDDEAHYDRLVEDLAAKIEDYFLVELAVAPGAPPPGPRRNVVEVPVAAGCWTPSGAWSESLMGLFCVELGLRFLPRKSLAGQRSRPFYAGIGLRAEYALGKSKPGSEAAFLHRIETKLPLELFLNLGQESSFSFALGGILEFDLLEQERNYAGRYRATSSASGIMASLSYRYALGGRTALGLDVEADSLFYSKPLVVVSPRLRFEYSFPGKRDPGREGKEVQ